jgi:hypothetical protein
MGFLGLAPWTPPPPPQKKTCLIFLCLEHVARKQQLQWPFLSLVSLSLVMMSHHFTSASHTRTGVGEVVSCARKVMDQKKKNFELSYASLEADRW